MGLFGPFFIDAGYSLGELGLLSGLGSVSLGLLGALTGGAVVRRFGSRRVLVSAVLAQASLLALVSVAAGTGLVAPAQVAPFAMVTSSAVMALGFEALYAQFMRWSDPRQGGVDFTLLQCMDAAMSMLAGLVAGVIAEWLGYGIFFCIASVVSVSTVPLILWAASGRRVDAAEVQT